MELQEIEVVIAKDGVVQLRVNGVKGTSCLDLTKDLERILGGQIVAREMTPEAHEQVETQQNDWDRASLRQ